MVTTGSLVLLVGIIVGVGALVDARNQRADDAAHQAALQEEITQQQQADAKAAEAKKKADEQQALNGCLDTVTKATTKALGDMPENSTPESLANYQQRVLQIEQNATQQCQAKYPVSR